MMTARSIASAPGRLPVLGNLVPLLRDPLRFLRSLPEHGDLVRVRLGPFSAIMVCDPGLTHQVDRKSTRLNSSHRNTSRMPSSA